MPNERTIPTDAHGSALSFTILSDGKEVPSTYQVASIVVNKKINRIPSASITIMDGDPSKQSFEVSNSPEFVPGKELEIKAGYGGEEKIIFKGIVIKHGLKVTPTGSLLMLECKDKAVKMTVSPKSKYYKVRKDSEIMKELIDPYGIENDVATTQAEHEAVVQYNSTDWDFLLSRADTCGLLCIPDDGKLTIEKPDFSAPTLLALAYGTTIYDLDAEIDARFQFRFVEASAWNPAENAMSNGVGAEDPEVPDAGNLSSASLSDVTGEQGIKLQYSGRMMEQELQHWANAIMLKHKLAKIRGKVTTQGTAVVKPGQMIQLNGVGERFEGKLFVTGVRQDLSGGNWKTTLRFGLKPEWFAQSYKAQQLMAGALLPAIQGLQFGIVTKLEGDPDGEDRIMVGLPNISNEAEGIWSRISTLDAGNGRGTFFRPEIGDEVVVGFINNDPRFAVILGMCNSSSRPAPLMPSDDNHEKGYVSRSKMKVMFNDDTKTISIRTPSGNKVTLSEESQSISMEDEHGNKLVMNESGIKLESIKDIVLNATRDVQASGINIRVKGSGSAELAGTAEVIVSTAGSLMMKGTVVNVN
jgi:Rhs element Vgr protein